VGRPDDAGLHATISRVGVFDEPSPDSTPPSRMPWVGVALALLLVVGAAAWWLGGRDDTAPATATTPTTVERPAPAPSAPAAAVPTPSAAEPERRAARKTPEPAPEAAPVEAAPRADAATLVIDSDVPGASVFVDREFVGTTPVTLRDVAPGTKRLNLSAEGFDGISRSVDVVPGEQTVSMRFKEVRLDASVAVSHRHGMGGGCQGTLRASVDGLSYETPNKGDAFTLRYPQIEAFEVDYLEKNLRVKQRGGRTWNFTDRQAENADRLFVFHREVQAARDKLAKGYTAAR
jgi:hypothetical protein